MYMNVLEWSRRKSDYFSGQLLLQDVKYTLFIYLFIYLFIWKNNIIYTTDTTYETNITYVTYLHYLQ